MGGGSVISKRDRLDEFFRRPTAAPSAADHDEAFRLVADPLDAVEDELTSIPHDPSRWRTDGRMYPPRPDAARTVPGRPDVTRSRSAGHNTLIGAGGAILVRDLAGIELFRKPGVDGSYL